MPSRSILNSPLQGRVVALPESRQLDVLAALFERRQAQVLRTPLVSIRDAPDQGPVASWLRQFIARPPDYFIILTGEGLRRLLAAARRLQLEEQFISALGQVTRVCRGPKPGRALSEIGLKTDIQGDEPTTPGIISALGRLPLESSRLAVQLYGEDPNLLLMDYLAGRQLAQCLPVAPYVYASDADTERVRRLIENLAMGQVDVIAFTSKPQLKRLLQVAKQLNLTAQLASGLQDTMIAAVGPVVRAEIEAAGFTVHAMPEAAYFMKPLMSAVESLCQDLPQR